MGNTSTNRVTAALFAFFLWWLGAHKFYLGRAGQGLMFAICTIFAIAWPPLLYITFLFAAVDGLQLLSMSDDEFARRHLGQTPPSNATLSGNDETGLRACPHCAETIKLAALVCKHCGRDVPAFVQPPTPSEDDIMRTLGIERVGDRYRYQTFMYDKLADAVNYARLKKL